MASVARRKPKPGEFDVEYERGRGWYLIQPDGTAGTQVFANRNAALSAKGHATRKAAEESRCKERSCMTCGKPFLSEGPHNRMCTSCRHLGQDIFGAAQKPAVPRRGNG